MSKSFQQAFMLRKWILCITNFNVTQHIKYMWKYVNERVTLAQMTTMECKICSTKRELYAHTQQRIIVAVIGVTCLSKLISELCCCFLFVYFFCFVFFCFVVVVKLLVVAGLNFYVHTISGAQFYYTFSTINVLGRTMRSTYVCAVYLPMMNHIF